MSFLTTIENIFHKAESAEQVVLSDVSSFVDKAEPIVVDIEDTLKTLPQTPVLGDIEKFLASTSRISKKSGPSSHRSPV